MRRLHRSLVVATAIVAGSVTASMAQDQPRFLLAPADIAIDDLIDDRGRIRDLLTDRQRADVLTLQDIRATARTDLALPPETAAQLEDAIGVLLRENPRFTNAVAELSDGRRFVIDRRAGTLMVSPTGGLVGAIPVVGVPTSDQIPAVLGLTDESGEPIPMTGPQAAGLSQIGDVPPCGANTDDPTTHCALSTVQLVQPDGVFCTGVTITNEHILTAAHCMCNMSEPGQVNSDVFAKFGSGPFFHAMFFEPQVAFYSEREGNHCAAGQTESLASDNGDLAVLTLKDNDPADNLTPVEFVAKRIIERAAALDVTLDEGEVMRLRAIVGETSAAVWTPQPAVGNAFATWGFGDGPDRIAGVKRALIYPFKELLPCDDVSSEGLCQGLQEALFSDRDHGLCAGDSGAGVFKPVDVFAADRVEAATLSGYGAWAIMGVVSGNISPSDCLDTDGDLLRVQHPRNITRIDTPKVAAWLDTVTQGQVLRRPVRMTFSSTLAGDP